MECSLLYTDFTHPSSWYALPEGTVQFCEVPILKPLPAREISPFNSQRLQDSASVCRGAVRQRSVRQETTIAKLGKLPFFCYQEKLPIERVSLRTKTRDSEEDPSTSGPAGSNEASSVDEEEQRDGTDRSDEFDADESDDTENEPASNESTRSDVPHLVSEAVFLVGRKSRFGRNVLYIFLKKDL